MMTENKIIFKIKSRRKTLTFFAAFFCFTIGLGACKKKVNPVGKGSLPTESLMTSDGVDTFSISTYTVEEGDVFSNDPEFNLLGSYMDPVFGEVSADFYTQLTLSGFDPDFEDLPSLVVDSAIMAFEYGGYYGNLNEQLFEVYEITEDLHVDSNYVSTSTRQTAAQNLVPTVNNEGLITPNVELPVVVGNDTLDPQLRIPLDKTFAKQLLTYADGASSDEDFLNLFKGLHFKVNNGMMSSGEGSILYLATTRPNSKLTVYYTVNGAQAEYEFIVTGRAADYNHVVTDYSSTRVQQVINDSTSGNEEFYAQAFSTRAKIDFPSIKDLPENIIVHSAKLHLPIDYYGGSNFYPSTEVNVSSVLFNDDSRKYIVSSVIYDEFSKSYIVDLRTYIQNILKGEIQNNGLYVSPKKYNTTAERIVFNGVDTQNKSKPKLSIVYTEL